MAAGSADNTPGPTVKPVAIPANKDHLWTGWTLVAGSYAVMGVYSYYSWYQEGEQRDFYVADDGWFGKNTYAGGEDKVGHCFSSYVITRTGYDV